MAVALPRTAIAAQHREDVETTHGSKPPHVAGVLVFAGIDPGGGAGIAADVRAIALAGGFACPVVSTLTIQSTYGLVRQHAVAASLLSAQAAEVLAHQDIGAFKTGALGSEANVRAVAQIMKAHPHVPLVVDPVRLPSRAASTRTRTRNGTNGGLLDGRGFETLRRTLLPLATLVTANVDEASVLTGIEVIDARSARRAAKAIAVQGARAALVKGGHLRGKEAVDFLALGSEIVEFHAPRLPRAAPHGGGCMLASLVAARLARASRGRERSLDGRAIVEAVRWSKARHHRLMATRAIDVGGGALVIR